VRGTLLTAGPDVEPRELIGQVHTPIVAGVGVGTLWRIRAVAAARAQAMKGRSLFYKQNVYVPSNGMSTSTKYLFTGVVCVADTIWPLPIGRRVDVKNDAYTGLVLTAEARHTSRNPSPPQNP
jgi:hypothetical protein